MVKTKLPLIWSSDAVWRLNRIYEWYTAYETVSRAKKVVNSIKSTARSISQNPYKHTQCHDIENPTPAIRKALYRYGICNSPINCTITATLLA